MWLNTRVRKSALKVDSGTKIPCRTGEMNLRQRRAGPTLYQLSYIPAPFWDFAMSNFTLTLWYTLWSLTHSIPGTNIPVPAIMTVTDQLRIHPHTASRYLAIMCSQLLATTTSCMRQHNVAPTCWQFSTGFDTHVNLSELLQNSWSEAESVPNTAGVKWANCDAW